MPELKFKNIIFLEVVTMMGEMWIHLAHHNLPKTAIP
jgi:hypothetical protein